MAPVRRVVRGLASGRQIVGDRVFEALKSRVERVRELCDRAGPEGTVKVSELRKIVGGGE